MGRLTKPLLDALTAYAGRAARAPWVPLLALLVITAGCLFVAGGTLKLDPKFEALLPQDAPAVAARNEARGRVGATNLYLIAVSSPDTLANYRFTGALAQEMRKWPEVRWVLNRRSHEIFRQHSLLYIDYPDLKEVADTLKRVVDRALKKGKRSAVGFIEIDDDLEEKRKREDKKDRDRLKELAEKYRNRAEVSGVRQGAIWKKHPELRDALINDQGNVAVVIALLTKGTNDVQFARDVYLRGRTLIQRLQPKKFHPEMHAEVSGAYRSFKEYDQAIRNVSTASLASLFMVLGLLIVFFRRVRTVLIVFIPLLAGIVWAAAFAGAAFGTMNIITSFIVAILIGLGIDFSIHLYAAYRDARLAGRDMEAGLREAVQQAGPGMMTAALTTVAALLTLTLAHFRAFREFGLIASSGVILCLLSAFLIIPPLVAALERVRSEKLVARERKPPPAGRLRLLGWAGLAVAGLATALLVWRAPGVGFEYDFKKLRGKGAAKGRIGYGDALRGSSGTSPWVLLGDSRQHIRLAHEELMRRQALEQACCDAYLAGKAPKGKWCRKMGLHLAQARRTMYRGRRGERVCRPRVKDLVDITTFVPTEQHKKLPLIRRIRATLAPDKKKGDPIEEASKDVRDDLIQLKKYAEVDGPLTPEKLPSWVRRTLTEKKPGPDGKPVIGHIGLLYSGMHFRDVRDMMRYAQDYAQIEVGERPVRVASSAFVVAEVVQTVQKDGRRLFLFAAIAVLLLLLIDLLSISGALICFVTLFLGLGWGLGLMQWLDLKLGVYNMLVVPTALGVGIDGTVHLYHRYRRLGREAFAERPLGSTGLAVIASALTTAAGFAGLLFIAHGGLRTIGEFAVIGILAILAAIVSITYATRLLLVRRG